jgi:hypothetical protein
MATLNGVKLGKELQRPQRQALDYAKDSPKGKGDDPDG